MKNKKAKLMASLTAAAAAVCMVTFGAITNKANNAAKPGNQEEQASSYGETEITSGESAGIKLMTEKIPVEAYAAYGVSEQAETAYTVTATVYPEDAANQKVDWSVAFANASSTWASGKKVTDYVTVTPSSEGALTAVVQNVAAFGEQIVVKTVSRDNAEAYATLNVEYLQRTTGYSFTLDGKTHCVPKQTTSTQSAPDIGSIYDETDFTVTPNFASNRNIKESFTVDKSFVYTRANTDKATYFTIKSTEAFKTAITNAGLSASALKEYSGDNVSDTLYNWFDLTWGKQLYSDNVQKNKLIAAMQGFSGTAYEIVIYTANGGTQLATFGITLDSSVIVGQKGVESVKVDQTELVF